jgi:predicted PurR-regulated permease PerM
MNQTVKNIISVAAAGIGLFLLWELRTLVAYFVVAMVLALIGRPLMKLLQKPKIKGKHLPNGVRSAITLLALIFFFSGIFSLFVPLVMEEARLLSSVDFEHIAVGLKEPIADLELWLHQNHLMSADNNFEQEILKLFSFTDVGGLFNSIIGILGNSVIALFSILFISFFLLKDRQIIDKIIYTLTPESNTTEVQKVMSNAKRLLSRYFIGIILQVTAITIVVSTGLSFIGVEHALLIGFLAGLINIIPYVGPLIGGVIGILIGISTNIDLDFYTQLLPLSGKIFLVFAIMQLMDNFIFQPLIFSNSVKAHPLEIFFVVLSAGTLWGITGMIVAIPFYTLFRVIAKEFLSEFKLIEQLTKNI